MDARPALRAAKAYLERLQSSPDDTAPGGTFMFVEGRGTLMLSPEDVTAFDRVVDLLFRVAAGRDQRDASPKTVQGWLRDAIFDVLRAPEDGRAGAVDAAVAVLDRRVRAPAPSFLVLLPLAGVRVPSRPWLCGRVAVHGLKSRYTSRVMKESRTILGTSPSPLQAKQAFDRLMRSELKSQFETSAIASVTVLAKDAEAAERQAQHICRQLCDLLNFFAIDVVPLAITAFASIDAPQSKRGRHLTVSPKNVVNAPLRTDRRPIDLESLTQRRQPRTAAIRRAMKAFASQTASPLDQRVLLAMQWIGRGHAEPRPWEGFLHYLIALEALLMPRANEGELTYRLRVRAAQVLARSPKGRQAVIRMITDLYAVRSAIVHRGLRDVEQTSLDLARTVAVRAAREMLSGRRFRNRSMDLEAWFLLQTLS